MEKRYTSIALYKKGIVYRYTFITPIDIRVNTFCDYLIDTYTDEYATFPTDIGHFVTYQAKEQQMPIRYSTQCLGNIFTHPIQIFLFILKFEK
jgi:hypothetical protein